MKDKMREILFKARRADKYQAWVYGSLVKVGNICYIIPESINQTAFIDLRVEVIPETVSQFTGLTDKNGVKIFEGDIIKFSTRRYHLGIDKGLQTITLKSDVIFNDGCFIISETQKYDTYLYAFNNESEIIGNIHD